MPDSFKLSDLAKYFPVTGNLIPKSGRNLLYLAEVAMLTRLATGVMRVLENRPAKQKNPNLTEGEKKQAMAERFFVEIFGTLGYMACLHLGQDGVNAIANKFSNNGKGYFKELLSEEKKGWFSKINNAQDFATTLGTDVDSLEQKIKESIKAVYGDDAAKVGYKNLIPHFLYGKEEKNAAKEVEKASLNEVKKKLATKLNDESQKNLDDAFKKIVHEVKPLKQLAQHSNNLAIAGIFAGVMTSAVVGGTLTQLVNDRLIAPSAKKFFGRKEMKKSMVAQTGKPGQPMASTASVAPRPLSLLSAPPTLPISNTPLPVVPAFLPNPKIQPAGAMFAARALNPRPLISPGGPMV